jgi:hypothetical protein
MRNYLLTSTAAFSPPDVPGSDAGGDVDTVETIGSEVAGGASEGCEAPASALAAPEPPKEDHSKPRVETVGESVRRSVAENKEKEAAAEKAKTAKKSSQKTAGADPAAADPAKPSSETTADGNTATAPQAASGPPASWTKEEKALWDGLPDAARAAIIRREADTEKGVKELRTRYTDIDTAVAPYKAVMTQNNVTPGQAISQLFKWHMELAGPNKVQAFQQLAKSFGIDPATIAAAPATALEKQAGADQGTQTIPENLRPVITDLETRIKSFEEQNAASARNAAQQTWVNWSKDKPHAETVRGMMAQLINGDLALIQAGQPQHSNTIKNGSIDMDAAYQAATYAHPEVRTALLQEEQAKRDKETRAAAEKAKKAGASMRSGAPAGAVPNGSPNAPKVETVAESIRRALAEVRGGTQH